MSKATWMGSVALVGLALGAFACHGSSDDEVSGTESKEVDGTTALVSGHYGELDLAVVDGKVSGSFSAKLGDPAKGGHVCTFTLGGGTDRGKIKVTAADGWDVVEGSLEAATVEGKRGLRLHLDRLEDAMIACSITTPDLFKDGAVVALDSNLDAGILDAGILGYRTVSAKKAWFYDAPGGKARAAYVVRGDTVVVTGAEQAGFLPVKYIGKKTTSGFVKTSTLAPTQSSAAKETPLEAGKFINFDNGAMLLLSGPCSTRNTLTAKTGKDVAAGALGDGHTMRSVGSKCGGYNLTQASEGVIEVTWKNDPDQDLSEEERKSCSAIEGKFEETEVGVAEACQ